ncbi:MAG TPA: hypothetical protein VF192_01120 [Longimicrobiales bacterium]
MGQVSIYGESDDLIEVAGNVRGCDEYNAEEATFVLIGKRDGQDARMRVRVKFEDAGLWSVCVIPDDEDVPLLAAGLKLSERGYSTELVVENVERVYREGA